MFTTSALHGRLAVGSHLVPEFPPPTPLRAGGGGGAGAGGRLLYVGATHLDQLTGRVAVKCLCVLGDGCVGGGGGGRMEVFVCW